jgi:hypothetical protein
MAQAINLAEKLSTFSGHWQPRRCMPNTGDEATAAPRRVI